MVTDEGISTRNWPVYAKGLSGIYLVVTFFLILIGNSFVIIVQARVSDKSIPVSTKHFMTNLAIADLGIGIFVLPFTVATILDADCCTSPHFQTLSGLAHYCFCIASILTLAFLSTDRYIALAFPLKFDNIMTPGRAKIMCALVWAHSATVAVATVTSSFRYQCVIPNIGSCTIDDWTGNPYVAAITASLIMLTFGLSLGCMFFSYFHIFLIAKRHAKKIQSEVTHASRIELNLQGKLFQEDNKVLMECEKEKQRYPGNTKRFYLLQAESPSSICNSHVGDEKTNEGSREMRQVNQLSASGSRCRKENNTATSQQFKTSIGLARNLSLIICVFFVCWSPMSITVLTEIGMGQKFNTNINLIVLWVAYSNSFYNPIIYCFRYRSFRVALRNTLGYMKSKSTKTRIKPFLEKTNNKSCQS